MSINMTYRGVEICFARSCKHQQNRVAFFPVFSCFSCLHQPNLRSPNCDDNAGTGLMTFSLALISCFYIYNLSLVLVVLVFSSDIGTELVTIETTRRGGRSRYRHCRCRTVWYLPCIFRLRTETIWVSATLRILINKSTIGFSYYASPCSYEIFRSSLCSRCNLNIYDEMQRWWNIFSMN